MTTPKLNPMQEVHTTTILEENENMRQSNDLFGSKLGKKKVQYDKDGRRIVAPH